MSFGGREDPLVDVSLGGFRIYSDEPLRVGQKLEIQLWLKEGEAAEGEARVVWISELPKGSAARYEVGFQFLKVSTELRDVLSHVLGEEGAEEG